jgi:putative spermidine/putrescine transport system ATP-binding protein
MSYLELANVRKTFGPTIAVNDFSLSVARGELISFLGPSGCGKTTTMRMIAGFENADQGRIWLDGAPLDPVPVNRRNIGMVFQSYALFPHLTVRDNIVFGMQLAGAARMVMRTRASEMLALIQMDALGDRYPHQLSGGQQQRVALARALATKPRVLLLDEPLSALDAKIRDELRAEIKRIQSELNITTIYVTHDQSEALAISDRIVVMHAGNIEQVGTPFEIYNRPRTEFVARFVGAQGTVSGTLTAERDCVETPAGAIRLARPALDRRVGETVHVLLRPEMVSLTGDNDGQGHNRIQGVVEQVTFLGSVVRVTVRASTGLLAVDQLNHPGLKLPTPRTPVSVSFAPEACHVV